DSRPDGLSPCGGSNSPVVGAGAGPQELDIMPRTKRTAPAKRASWVPSTPPAAPLGSQPAGMDRPIPPDPRSTTDPSYQEWLDCVCIRGEGFVARAASALAEQMEAIPTIK